MSNSSLVFALSALKKANTANERIDNLPLPMVFKGTLGTGGTISTLPTASSSNEGYVYIVITDGTYAGISAKAGDTFVSDGSSWVLVPSADEPSVIDDSVTSTALTWSSSKINTEFNSVKIKSLDYRGNGTDSTPTTIQFPEVPRLILGIFNNTSRFSTSPFYWGQPVIVSAYHQENLTAGPVYRNVFATYEETTLSLLGQFATYAMGSQTDTYTVYYI